MAKQKQRIVNANTQVGRRRGEREERGPVEFSDRYRGPQSRIVTELERSKAPQSERSQTPKGAALTRSAENKQALTSPRLATERTTLPQAQRSATDERAKQSQPEATSQRQQAQTVSPAQRPKLQEASPRDASELEKKVAVVGGPEPAAKVESPEERIARKNRAIASAPKVPFSDRVSLNPVNDPLDTRRRASR